jgi:hypothetical protein
MKIELDSDMSVRTFVTSFFDGFTGGGIFGDLRRPGTPDTLFEEDEPELAQVTNKDSETNERIKLQGSGEKPEGT